MFEKLKQRILWWLIKKLNGGQLPRDPITVLWNMIDEENSNPQTAYMEGYGSKEYVPDCHKIEVLEQAIDRLKHEYSFIPLKGDK